MITRRGLLAGILSAGFAPAAIGSGVLMPVRAIAQVDPFGVRGIIRSLGRGTIITDNGRWTGDEGDFIVFVHPEWEHEYRCRNPGINVRSTLDRSAPAPLFRGEIGRIG